MEVDTGQNLQDDPMSDCQTFGGNYHPSSKSRKISIGILIDSLVNKESGAIKGDKVVVPNAERANSNKESSVEGQNKGKDAIDASGGKKTEAPEQITSPWITARSFRQKTPTSETFPQEKETSNLPVTGGRRNKLSRLKDAPVTHSVEFFANQTSILHSGDGQKKFGGFTYKRKRGKDRNSQTAEEFTFATTKDVLVSDKSVKDDKTEGRRTETLRMKLWEILGPVSSPKSQPTNSQAHKTGANNVNQEKIPDQKVDAVLTPRQNSDTIETDSESPNHTMKRPVTRSLSRKRASTKRQIENSNAGLSSSYRQKLQDRNIFSFREGLLGKGDVVVSGGTSASTKKKGKVKRSIEPCKISFAENNTDKIQGATHRCETSLSAEKTSSLGNKMGNFHGCPPQNKRDVEPQNRNQERDSPQSPVRDSHQSIGTYSMEPQNRNQERDSPQSPARDSHQSLGTYSMGQQEDINSPVVPKNGDKPENFGNPSLKNVGDPRQDFKSPTFKINTPISSSSPSSTPKTDEIKQGVCSPAMGGGCFTVRNIRGFRSLQTLKADCYASSGQTELPDIAARIIDSPPGKTSPLKGKNDVEDGLSESSSEDGDSESSEEASPIMKSCRERDIFSPEAETETADRSKFMLYPSKRFCNHEGDKVSKFCPNSPSPKGTGETDWIPVPEPSKQNQEDELERVVMLFALALENFKNKMKSATRKKSSEILMPVSEEIRQQLQNIEFQIQTDLGKLTSVGKSKRKHLETRFQEQQEQLKLIHEKFKQDIYQHLQDCRSTLEGLEVHQIELKGTVKKQKASHQKLLLQVEEAVETQLNDAQRRITALQKLAREKMLQLRHVIAECLNDGVLS